MKKFSEYLNEDLNDALVEPSSVAAIQAKKLGLQYVGFGRYEDPKTQQITFIVQNDRLVPFSKAIKSNTFKQASQDDYGNFVKQTGDSINQMQAFLVDYYKPEYFEDAELSAIESYTGDGYTGINQKLYSLPTGIKGNQIEPDFDGDLIPQQVQSLDSALSKLKTPADFQTYIGIGSGYNITDFSPGKTAVFKGFRSTTINPNVALNNNTRTGVTDQKKQTVVLQIKVPKGSTGMLVDDFSASPGESEFLLPRASKIQIVGGPNKLVGSNAFTGDSSLEVLYFDCKLVK
jgi:hypothetical protein